MNVSIAPKWRMAWSVVTGVLAAAGVCPQVAHGQINIPPPARVVQLPTFGVSVDAAGVMQIQNAALPGGQNFVQKALQAQARLPQRAWGPSKLRKVSLRRLAEQIQLRLDQGEPLTESMRHLAGLTQVTNLFVVADQGDIVLAGPAEGWINDADGRAVGMFTGRPIVLLDDLLVALRVFDGARPNHWVGCSIGPSAESLRRLNEFQRSLPDRVPEEAKADVAVHSVAAIEQALGLAHIQVFGIPADSHMARVLIEADYQMKLIAIGRQPPPIDMPTFFSESKRPGKNLLQRWWFTPDYKRVLASPDGQTLRFKGSIVQLGTEDYRITTAGQIQKINAKPGPATRRYAQAFTKHYDRIAEMSPVYAQMRNMIDLLVTAAYLNRKDDWQNAEYRPLLLDDQSLPTEKLVVPTRAPYLANAAWRKNRLIAPSGGVSIQAELAIHPQNLALDNQGDLSRQRESVVGELGGQKGWWWD